MVFSGHLTRGPYALRMIVAAMLAGASQMAAFDEYDQPTRYIGLHVVVLLTAIVMMASFVVKRLRDLDRPGTHYWLAYVPLYNIYFGLQLLLQEGVVASGTALPAVASAPPPDGAPSPSVISRNAEGVDVYCGRCGVESPANAKYCWQCGAVLYGAIGNRARTPTSVTEDTSNDLGVAQVGAAPRNRQVDTGAEALTLPPGSTESLLPAMSAVSADASNGQGHDGSVPTVSPDAAPGPEVDEVDAAGYDRHWAIAILLFALMVATILVPFCHRAGDA